MAGNYFELGTLRMAENYSELATLKEPQVGSLCELAVLL